MCGCGDLKYSSKNHNHGNLYYTKRQVGLLLDAVVEDLQLQIDALQAQIDACCDGGVEPPDGNDPLSYWQMAGDLSDAIGNRDLTAIGDAFIDTDNVLQFQFLRVSNEGWGQGSYPDLGVTGDLTLAGWVGMESIDPTNLGIFASKYEWGVDNRGYRFGVSDVGKLRFTCSPDGTYSFSLNAHEGDTTLQVGYHYHVAAVFDSVAQTMSIYLDGSLDSPSKNVAFSQLFPSTAPFMLGANLQSGAASQGLDGRLWRWRIYDRALSGTEITDLAGEQYWP